MNHVEGLSIVVTGASSGIGRATALALARGGARLTLAARGARELEATASECMAQGGAAIAVPTDVTDAEAVEKLASAALQAFGRLDVWINGVGVGAFGRFEDTPIGANRRVIEVNLLGALNGAHAALDHFRRQGRGIIINVNSLGAWVPSPYAAAYGASKWGLLGFSESLRAELSDAPGIAVCDVFPSFVNTPGLEHGANYVGRALTAPPPVIQPEAVARAIVSLIRRPRRVSAVGSQAKLARLAGALAPRVAGWVASRVIAAYLRRAPKAPTTDGNLFETAGPANRLRGKLGGQNAKLLGAGVAAAALVFAMGVAPRLLRHTTTPGRPARIAQ